LDHIHDVDLVVSSLERSLAFCGGLLTWLGYVIPGEIEGERGERVVYLNPVGGDGGIGLREVQSPTPAPYDRYTIGVHHIAFPASSRRAVDDCANWLRAQGATIESEPREYGYSPGYYAVFFYDPDGLKIELVHQPKDPDLVREVVALRERLAQLEGRARRG
jgi:catechol 2,3-dioxygenase-like lactoylglutathione lyase family enzyme